jgi:hypothetical protein
MSDRMGTGVAPGSPALGWGATSGRAKTRSIDSRRCELHAGCLRGRNGCAGGALGHRQVDAAAPCRPARASRRGRCVRGRANPAQAFEDDRRTAIRRSEIGFVYQFHHLLPEFTALENIMMPQLISGLSKSRRQGAGRAIARLHAHRPPRRPSPGGIVGRRTAARGDCPCGGQRGRWCCSPTNPPAISTRKPPATCSRRSMRLCASRACPPSSPPTTTTWPA